MSRPNVVIMMTDHTNAQALRPASPCQTPALDALAADGVRFEHCHTPNAICSPARASLMTALYPSTHGMWDCTHTQRREWVDVPKERFRYFSQNLADAGYHNGYFGKWHVEQSNRLEDFGWHDYDLSCSSGRCAAGADSKLYVRTPGYRDFYAAGVADDADDLTHPAWDRGIEFIEAQLAADQPFCCFMSAIEPHDPYVALRAFFDRYELDQLPLSPSLHDELADKPDVVRRLAAVWRDLSDDDWRYISACYWAVISFLDAQCNRVIELLRNRGALDNTIVVFTSDHGDMLGAHGLLTKGIGTAYDEVYNVPLIMRLPAGPRGRVVDDARVSLVDLAPTLLDLCGAAPLPDAQGRSMRPLLDGTAATADWDFAYAEFFGQRHVYTQRLVWEGDWKYVFNPAGVDELYDLANDPHERRNRIADPACAPQLRRLLARMWRQMAEIDDQSLLNAHYATLRVAPIGPLGIAD